MTPEEALELSTKFPKNRTVPKRIFDAMQKTRGDERKKYEMIIEGLYTDAIDIEDFKLLNKYFDLQADSKQPKNTKGSNIVTVTFIAMPSHYGSMKPKGKKKKVKKGGKK